jgi:UDP-N-acetyl-D-mannosaminuronate dehydrogenase
MGEKNTKMKPLIIGFGSVGKTIYEVVKGVYPETQWLDVKPKKIKEPIDIMHICYPASQPKQFEETTIAYIKKFNPKTITIINSTVPPGTTNRIYQATKKPIVHSPVRGLHSSLKRHIFRFTKYIGAPKREWAEIAKEHFESLGIECYICRSPLETEVGKILDTTQHAYMIAFSQEMHRWCRELGADFNEAVTHFNMTYESGKDPKKHPPRPMLFPDVIGGTCLIPNINLLKTKVDSKFLQLILDSNEKRKEEMENMTTKKEVTQIKKAIEEYYSREQSQ